MLQIFVPNANTLPLQACLSTLSFLSPSCLPAGHAYRKEYAALTPTPPLTLASTAGMQTGLRSPKRLNSPQSSSLILGIYGTWAAASAQSKMRPSMASNSCHQLIQPPCNSSSGKQTGSLGLTLHHLIPGP